MHSNRIKNTLSTHARYKYTAISKQKNHVVFGRFVVPKHNRKSRSYPNCQLGETEGSRTYLGNPPPTTNNNYNKHPKRCQVKITMQPKILYTGNAMYDIINPH